MDTTPDRLADPVFAERYRAMVARDARFDGQFITGVHSTGIYCRPSCPAVAAKPGNVTFYLTAAAAHEAGLRACKRCLPDAVPGSPEWNIRDDLAARAMRLIADGTVEREGVPGLAHRLGYTPRHLGRVLTAELGAGPLALARAHRAQTARLLLAGTDLPVTDVAFAAGFTSVRQFNETFAEIYRTTPGAIRASVAGRAGRPHAPECRPGDPAASGFPPGRPSTATPFSGSSPRAPSRASSGPRTALTRGPLALRTARPSSASARRHAGCTLRRLRGALSRTSPISRRWSPASAACSTWTRMRGRSTTHWPPTRAWPAACAAAPGLRVPGAVDAEEILFRALIGQQVSVAAARTALGRLTEALGRPIGLGGFTRLFPTASDIAEHGREVLRGPGPARRRRSSRRPRRSPPASSSSTSASRATSCRRG